MPKPMETIRTRIWDEAPEEENPFVAEACYCRGYDVYGDILKNASWAEYLYLLFLGERPSSKQGQMLESLAIALANPGPRDYSVRAAMNGGVGGSTNAASLMAALAVGAGELGGAREVYYAVEMWQACGTDFDLWKPRLRKAPEMERADVWFPMEHIPGFDPYAISAAKPVSQVIDHLARFDHGLALKFLKTNLVEFEEVADSAFSMTGAAAATLFDLGFDPDQAEMLYLLLRLPGAAVHALEQKEFGWRKFPFFDNGIELTNDPG